MRPIGVLVLVVLLAAPLRASAQAAAPDGAVAATSSASVAAEVAVAIAGRWNVDAGNVIVELISDGDWPVAGTAFRLTGSGSDGRWAIWFDDPNGARQLLVRAGVRTTVVTAARDLERGTELTAADLSQGEGVHWGAPPPGPVVAVTGWVTRRRIAAGDAIRRPAAEPPQVVRSGDDVRIEVIYGTISLSLTGRAGGSGALGETVTVRAQTGKRLEGVIVAPGLIRIGTLREE